MLVYDYYGVTQGAALTSDLRVSRQGIIEILTLHSHPTPDSTLVRFSRLFLSMQVHKFVLTESLLAKLTLLCLERLFDQAPDQLDLFLLFSFKAD